jgi:NTP pyrophosphatase (non-canonical NTP hydrolase)
MRKDMQQLSLDFGPVRGEAMSVKPDVYDWWTLDMYQKRAMRTAGTYADPSVYGALKIAEETGELVGQITKKIYGEKEVTNKAVAKELGDVLWNIAFLARAFGYDLSEVAYMNVEKLKERWPDGHGPGQGVRNEEE